MEKSCWSLSIPIYNILQIDNGNNRSQRWPGNLPALNPIENLLSPMRNLQQKVRVTSIARLKKTAQKVCRQVTPDYLKMLYLLILRQMETVI